MISFKKSYAEQMLQLALALSLLQVDPENYYGHGWDTHLPLRNGDGWQLEMLRAAPISEYPYANRKAIMPLIEDLVRFDRQRNMDEITAYLLNVQNANDQNTGGGQEHNSTATVTGAATATVTVDNPNNNSSGATMIQELDLFLNHDHFVDFASIPEQNIADLRDYGEIPLNSMPYLGLPLKDEPPDPFASFPLDIEIKQELPSTSATSELGSLSPEPTNSSGSEDNPESASASVKFRVKKERNDSGIDDADEDDEEKSSASPSSEDIKQEVTVKREPELDEDDEDDNEFSRGLFDFSDFFNEESEIVDVLWKQDVDLGFSLSPLKITNGNNDTPAKTVEDDDDVEKLKALQELKNDKSKDEDAKDDLEDEWAGIRFTIDNETGEYIQLQFDEILQDVLQLPDLTTEPEEDQEVKSENDNDLSKQKSGENPSDPNPGVEEKDSADLTDLLTQSDDCPTGLDEPPQTEVEISSQSPIFDLEDASALDEIEMMIQSAGPFQHHRPGQNYATNSAFRQSGFHHHHHHPHQSRVPLSRSVSMEQRFQDIANLFNPIPTMGVGMGVSEMSPYSHYPTHYPYQTTPGLPQHGQFQHPAHPVLHNASLADLGASQPHYGHNLGSAVSSSMHITNSSHEGDAGATGYKMEHDMMYYSNTSSELNHTTDGFINSILNDEDLHLMDMGVNEGFCSMRMLEGNTGSNNSSVLGSGSSGSHGSNILSMPPSLGPLGGSEAIGSTGDRLDASSDSAVSSMGSERVPSLSDGEWGDIGSDSAQEYHQGKYGGPYDYSYNSRLGDSVKQPVAQKKHQMFGKRYFQEQPNIPNLPQPSNGTQPTEHMPTSVKYEYEPYRLHQTPSLTHNMEGAVGPLINKDHVPLMTHPDMKYACSLDFSARQPRTAHDLINHNHTYTLPQGSGSTPRPQLRDKKQRKAEEEHLTRDEKRARALNIPITVNDIINLPMDEFNERLSKYDLSENQLSLIRDIRRRGKNKVAAQNCRKRKLDQILSLEDEVKEVRRRKDRLLHEHEVVYNERKRIAEKFAALHRHVFQYLRDSEGNPCSPSQYSLQQAADGSVYLLRRENKPDGSTAATNHTAHGNSSNHHHASGPSPPSSHHQKE